MVIIFLRQKSFSLVGVEGKTHRFEQSVVAVNSEPIFFLSVNSTGEAKIWIGFYLRKISIEISEMRTILFKK
jgi:hypothetical protein